MESDRARSRTLLRRAVGVSLLLHAAVLFIGYSPSAPSSRSGVTPKASSAAVPPSLVATLVGPAAPPSKAQPPVKAPQRPKPGTPGDSGATPKWTQAERDEMDQFLNELAVETRPKTGSDLAQKALAQARQMGRRAQDDGEEAPAGTPTRNGQAIEPFSWELYFDAFVRKLNRSAAFVERAPASRQGRSTRKALVRISLNADGSLKSYRVLRAADRDAELDYIRRVVEQAAPFSAFPPDIRSATDSLSILLCVYPPREGEGGGFARSFGDEDCKG